MKGHAAVFLTWIQGTADFRVVAITTHVQTILLREEVDRREFEAPVFEISGCA